jgi:hypothetical protein
VELQSLSIAAASESPSTCEVFSPAMLACTVGPQAARDAAPIARA